MKSIKIGKYRHNKSGNLYEVLGVATHSESREVLVVYSNLYDDPDYPVGSLWVRPYDMFNELVELDGEKKTRFEYVGKMD